jgi:phosphoglycolate phosphatase
MPYKLAIFDFDGTLANSFPWALNVIDQVADQYHLKRIDKNEIETLRKQGARKILKDHKVPVWKLLFIARHIRKLMTQSIDDISLFEGIDGLLHDLSDQGVTLGLVTSNAYENVYRVLGPQNAALFQHYECSVSLFGKPGRLKKILRKSDVHPGEAIYIGDEIRDLEAARKVRMPFGAVAWGYTHPDALVMHSPNEVFTTIEQIAQKIAVSKPS